MRIVYLDQSHINRMAKERLQVGTRREPNYCAILKEMERLVAAGEVICPYSFWHVMETAGHDNEQVRNEVYSIMGVLSVGSCFRWPEDVAADEIKHVVKAGADQVVPLGTAADCFPAEVLTPETRSYFRDLGPTQRFGALAQGVREAPDIRWTALPDFKTKNMALERKAASVSKAAPPTRGEAGILVRAGVIAAAVERCARDTGIGSDEIAKQLGNLDRVPTLALLAEVLAQRWRDVQRIPQIGDAVDLGHLVAAPYCDFVLTERYVAALARGTFERLAFEPKPTIVSDVSELLDWLTASHPRA